MSKEYKPEIIQKIEIVLAKYGAGINLGLQEDREKVSQDLWETMSGHIVYNDNLGDDIEYNYVNNMKDPINGMKEDLLKLIRTVNGLEQKIINVNAKYEIRIKELRDYCSSLMSATRNNNLDVKDGNN